MNARRATHYTPWRLRGLRSRMDAQYRSWPENTTTPRWVAALQTPSK